MAFIVVTGASRGVGLAITEILLNKFKANVLTLSRSRTPELDDLAKRFPSNLHVVQCDITDKDATTSALSKCPCITGLVLNAGSMAFGRIGSDDPDEESRWRQLFDVNFFSLIHTVRASLPQLRASNGRIVFLSSGAATGGMAGWGAYNASKAAMNSLCRTLANEEPDIISVALRPGKVDTEMQRNLRAQGADHMSAEEHAGFVDSYNKGELVKPADAGHVAAALALRATKDLSGKFVVWNQPELAAYRA